MDGFLIYIAVSDIIYNMVDGVLQFQMKFEIPKCQYSVYEAGPNCI